jgi:hypothetical protein
MAVNAPPAAGFSLPRIFDSPLVGARHVRIVSNPVNTIIQVYSGQCVLVGVLVRAGAATSECIVYDVAFGSGTPPDNSVVVPQNEVARARATTYSGFVNFPIAVQNGLVAQVDQTDAVAFVYYYPISTVARGG